ncbi:MAG: P-loop NTPase [Candidatus Hydrogenedentes bacterium]|nr:P-loop NTPase [Candidatus Hydrogenedentota bacterium]
MVTESQVLDAMRHIMDPDFNKDIVTLGFIKDIKIDDGTVAFTVELTTPACPVKEHFKKECESSVAQLPGVKSVQVNMSAMAPKEKSGPQIDTLKRVDSIIAVSSCKGGVGKSTVAAHLARAIQREGHKVGLLDVDIYGPSLPTLFNIHQPDVFQKNNLIEPVMSDGLKTMSLGYVMGDRPAVMRGPMVSNYTSQILQQTDWGELDYLIIDMPPGTGDIQLTLVQQASLDGAVIVTTPQALSLVDVARGILMFESVKVPVLGIVENMSYFLCDNCEKKHFIFGNSVATLKERFGLNTLAQLPLMPGVSDASTKDSGADVPAFKEMAEQLHREVGKRRLEGDALPEVVPEHGRIRVTLPDGNEFHVANKALRVSCQCALCVNEFSGQPILDPASVAEDIKVESVAPLGNYAIGIVWSDGHSSGIFSWEHIKRVGSLTGEV